MTKSKQENKTESKIETEKEIQFPEFLKGEDFDWATDPGNRSAIERQYYLDKIHTGLLRRTIELIRDEAGRYMVFIYGFLWLNLILLISLGIYTIFFKSP